MGIDFSHGNAHWSYSGFHAFRKRLASTLGLDLDDMKGFGGDRSWEDVTDHIKELLDHSDCDGELSPEACIRIAPRLRDMVTPWADDDYDKINAMNLADGMELAAAQNNPLMFC
ncbi:MAG TPA: hypothetical protein VFE62_01420 [Gemmataceae bacterium]|nr:hypothetical protein [Gemmataceae bacterium]